MRYSINRLEEALLTFRASEEYLARRGLVSPNLEQFLTSKYSLRSGRSRHVSRIISAGSWVDHDESGDYCSQRLRRPRVTTAAKKRKHDEARGLSVQLNSARPAKRARHKFGSVTLKFKTSAGTAFLRNLDQQGEGNGNEGVVIDYDEEEQPSSWSLAGGSFSKRSAMAPTYSQSISSSRPNHEHRKATRNNGSDISSNKPCKQMDCKNPFRLSEEYTFKDHLYEHPCPDCTIHKARCNCGPSLDNRKTENAGAPMVVLDNDIDHDPRYRAFLSCEPCRKAKKKCSLKAFSQGGPCYRCIRTQASCAFIPLQDLEVSGAKETTDVKTIVPRAKQVEPAVCEGMVRVIETPWVHPVNFKHEPTDEAPCHFHHDHKYGMFGRTHAKIEVFIYPGSSAYEETGAGPRARGAEQTRMCISCALEKLHISNCAHGHLSPIDHSELGGFGEEPADRDIQYIFDQSLDTLEALVPECAVCIAPAYYTCSRNQLTNKWGEDMIDGMESIGCGLALCRLCAKEYEAHGVVKAIVEAAGRRGDHIRADSELLLLDSLLHQALRE